MSALTFLMDRYLWTCDVQQIGPRCSILLHLSEHQAQHRTGRDDLLTWVQMIDRQPTHPRCKSFVEPKLAPPIHGHQVAEPLVGKFCMQSISICLCFAANGAVPCATTYATLFLYLTSDWCSSKRIAVVRYVMRPHLKMSTDQWRPDEWSNRLTPPLHHETKVFWSAELSHPMIYGRNMVGYMVESGQCGKNNAKTYKFVYSKKINLGQGIVDLEYLLNGNSLVSL